MMLPHPSPTGKRNALLSLAEIRRLLKRGDLRDLARRSGLSHTLYVRVLRGTTTSAPALAALRARAAERAAEARTSRRRAA